MSSNSQIRSILSEHRLCGPAIKGCAAVYHYPRKDHCHADGMGWPCDVEVIRVVLEPMFREYNREIAELQAAADALIEARK